PSSRLALVTSRRQKGHKWTELGGCSAAGTLLIAPGDGCYGSRRNYAAPQGEVARRSYYPQPAESKFPRDDRRMRERLQSGRHQRWRRTGIEAPCVFLLWPAGIPGHPAAPDRANTYRRWRSPNPAVPPSAWPDVP